MFVPKSRPHAPVSSYSLAALLVVIGEEALLAFKGAGLQTSSAKCGADLLGEELSLLLHVF